MRRPSGASTTLPGYVAAGAWPYGTQHDLEHAVRPGIVAGYPGAAAPRHPPGADTELRARPDHGLFQRAHVGHDIQRLAELDDRIPGQLPRAVPGDLAAAVHVDDRRSRIAEWPV